MLAIFSWHDATLLHPWKNFYMPVEGWSGHLQVPDYQLLLKTENLFCTEQAYYATSLSYFYNARFCLQAYGCITDAAKGFCEIFSLLFIRIYSEFISSFLYHMVIPGFLYIYEVFLHWRCLLNTRNIHQSRMFSLSKNIYSGNWNISSRYERLCKISEFLQNLTTWL